MDRLLLESAVRAIVVAGGTAAILVLLRIRTAPARHRAWTGVLLLMLVLPAWVASGLRLPMRVLPVAETAAESTVSAALITVQNAAAGGPRVAAPPERRPYGSEQRSLVPQIAIGIYLLGVATFLSRLGFGTVQARRLRRRAVMQNGRLTSGMCATPIAVGWLTPVIILPVGWQQWSATQLSAVLTHEHAHVRRRDPFVQWLSLLNLSIFWFHPLAWWLKRRLATLAEEACDATVLAAGHSPEDYSGYLLDLARVMRQQGRRLQIVGHPMAGSDLSVRIRQILTAQRPTRVSRTRRVLALMFGISAAIVGTSAAPAPKQTPSGAPATPTKFDVAAIKQNTSGSGQMGLNSAPGGRLVATNVTLRQLIATAYDLQEYQLLGAPDWIAKERFDIEAVGPAGTPTNIFARDPGGGPSRGELMIRTLLADRFKLNAHTETRDLQIYALVLDRKDGALGPQLKHSTRDCAAADAAEPPPGTTLRAQVASRCEIMLVTGNIVSGGVSIATLGEYLSPLLERTVLDRTGLSGNFEFTLTWTPEQFSRAMNAKADELGLNRIDEHGASIGTALKEQLGIRLDAQKGPATVLVIDRVAHLPPGL